MAPKQKTSTPFSDPAIGQAHISTDGAKDRGQSFEGTNFEDQIPFKLSDRTSV